MKKVLISILTILLVSSFFLSGCGNNTEINEKSTKKEKLLAEIKKRGKVVVGTEAAYAPFEFMENGKIVGYGSDILSEVIKNLNVEMEQLDTPFSGILPGLEEKKFDFIATAIVFTNERNEKFGLTMPIGEASLTISKRKNDDSIKSLDDLNGKIVGCVGSTPAVTQMEKFDAEQKALGKEGLKEIKIYQGHPDHFVDLKNGRVDAVAQAMPVALVTIKAEPDVYEMLSTIGDKRYVTWATRKEDQDLLNFLNEEIEKLKKSGKLAELQQKWFGTTWDLPEKL